MIDTNLKNRLDDELKRHPNLKWYHKFEIIRGSGVYTPRGQSIDWLARFRNLSIDPNLFAGKRILDIGAFTGALTFLLEDFGAQVVSLDVADPDQTGFNIVHRLRGSSAKFFRNTVYNLNSAEHGMFDAVMFFGVFYHLKHPLLAFERINAVIKDGGMLIGGGTTMDAWFHDETEGCARGAAVNKITPPQGAADVMTVENLNDLQLCGFAEKQFIGERNNWFIPNTQCVLGWLRTSGFTPTKWFSSQSRLQREWNSSSLERSIVIFSSEKTGDPVPEAPQAYLGNFQIKPVQP